MEDGCGKHEPRYIGLCPVTYLPEERFCFLGVVLEDGGDENSDTAEAITNQLVSHLEFISNAFFPILHIVILGSGRSDPFKRKMRQVKNALILQR
ncbi:MAG: hypothetical protein F6K09_19505 [Merismopedia sp. SIO2A8]|nr:hypothetical protein [Symploca sp. SIO2B6]NET50834.1 hypothetical protein [Merismopedia sp. SIO2A8]